jgi:hypothetical protein
MFVDLGDPDDSLDSMYAIRKRQNPSGHGIRFMAASFHQSSTCTPLLVDMHISPYSTLEILQ